MTPFARALLLCIVLALVALALLNTSATRGVFMSWLPMFVLSMVWLLAVPLLQKSQMNDYFAKLEAMNARLHAENEAIIRLLTEIRNQRRAGSVPSVPAREPASTPAGNPWAAWPAWDSGAARCSCCFTAWQG